MAGALTVAGNETPFAEANVRVDPEAAGEVFSQRSAGRDGRAGCDVKERCTTKRISIVCAC